MRIERLWVVGIALLLGMSDSGYPEDLEFRTIRQYVFGVGERMEYSIKYGVIAAGNARIRVDDFVMVGERPCFKIVSEAWSKKFFDIFFKVRDRVETWMDVGGLFTWRFEKRLNEGGYHDHKVVTYDYANGRATCIDDGVPTDTTALEHEVQDGLSCLFWARLQPMKEDTVLTIPTLDIRKVYQVRVNVLGIDTVNTPAGSFRCFKVEPFLEGAGIFKKDPGGKIWLWFSDDALRLPVMMQTKVFFGHITARLTRYLPGKTVPYDLSIIREELEKRKKGENP
jgi:hypothetical protein